MSTPPNARAVRRRRILLAGLIPAVISAAIALYPPGWLTRLDFDVYDTLLGLSNPTPLSGRVVIVDVDERSLSAIGQWPWRRDIIGQLVTRLREMSASTIALDIIFSEPDREDRLQAAPVPDGPDAALADSLRPGHVVLGYALTFDAGAIASRRCVLHPLRVSVVQPEDQAADPPLFHAADALCSLPVLAEAAGSSGFLNAVPDSDGILRRVPLAIELNGRVYPALALAAVLSRAEPGTAVFRIANANTTSLAVGDLNVPLDGRSNLFVRYRGRRRTFPYVSAADVLAGRLPPGTFKDKIVFVGATALGTQELIATPYDPLFAGVEVQATVADNLLKGDFIRRPEHAQILQGLSVLCLAAVVTLLTGYASVAWGGVAAVIGLGALWGTAIWLIGRVGVFVSPLVPAGGLVMVLAAVAATAFVHELRAALATLSRTRRESAAAMHAKSEFLRTVSHELRTPLTAIYGYTQMLAKGALRDEQRSRALATIERNAQAQSQLIDDILDASLTAAGKLRLHVKDVHLAAMVRSVAEVMRPAVNAKGITLSLTLDDGLPAIPGDPDRLRQIVWHVMSNSIKFTPEGGQVEVRLEHVRSSAHLTFSDSGTGIPRDFLPHVFEEFRQQDESTTRQYGGLGLGLALARHIVELHGGSVDIESEGHGHGTTVCVRLPLRGAASNL